MTDIAPQTGGYMVYTPTLRQRFWRKLGFRHHLGEEPSEVGALTGWMATVTHIKFDFASRLRLLLTGRLYVQTIAYMDTPSPRIIKNRMDWQIYAPGEQQ